MTLPGRTKRQIRPEHASEQPHVSPSLRGPLGVSGKVYRRECHFPIKCPCLLRANVPSTNKPLRGVGKCAVSAWANAHVQEPDSCQVEHPRMCPATSSATAAAQHQRRMLAFTWFQLKSRCSRHHEVTGPFKQRQKRRSLGLFHL